MPSTIAVAGGLVHPLLWYGLRFPAVGQRVNRFFLNMVQMSMLF